MFNIIWKHQISKIKISTFLGIFLIILILIYILEPKEAYVNLQGENLKYLNTNFCNIKASGACDKINLSNDVTLMLFADSCSIFNENKLVCNTNGNDILIISTDGDVFLSDNNNKQIEYHLYAMSRYGFMTYHCEGLPFENEHRSLVSSKGGDICINNLCPLERGQEHDWLLKFNSNVSISKYGNGEIGEFTDKVTIVANNIMGIGATTCCESITFDNDVINTQFKDDWTFTSVADCKVNIKGTLTFSKEKNFQNYNIGNQDVFLCTPKNKYITSGREELSVNISHIENSDDFKVYVSGNVGEVVISKTNLFYTIADFIEELNL